MNTLSIILTSLLLVALAIIWAPGIMAMNRGHVLRNIAGWLAIMLVLALVYQNFHPDKGMVVPRTVTVNAPPAAKPLPSTEPSVPKLNEPAKEEAPAPSPATTPSATPSDDQGYTPPRED